MYVNLAKYDNPACLEALQYKEALIAEAKELSSAYPLLVESPSPGSGKTKIIAEEILAPKDIHAMVMSPINSLGWDLQARSPARAWAGLGADGPDGEPLCRRRVEAQRIEAAGGSRRKLCEGCLFFDGCPGRRMIDSWHEAPSIAGTHAHLMLGRPDEMACDVDAVVIDESPVGTLRPGHKRIELADIVLHGDEAGSLAVFRLQNVIRESVEGVGVRQADLSRLDRAGLKAARKALYRLVAERYDMSVEDLMAAEPVAKLRRLIGLLEAILYRPCDGERRGDIIKQSGGVMLSLHGELAVWAQGKAVLLATATPEPDDVLADVMSYTRFVPVPKYKGGAIELDTTPVTCRPVIEHMPSMDLPAGKNVTIRRYTGVNMSARGLGLSKEGMQCRTVAELEVAAAEEEWPSSTLRNRRAELERRLGVVEFLRRESMGGRRVVVVATAEIRIWLAGHSLSVDYLPWGKAIGSNSFENYDALVVLGSKTEPVHVRHMRACDYTGEWSDKHGADPVSDHLRSAELHQAVERLRTRRGKAKPVTVHIFDDSPLPISIEEVDGRKLLNSILLDLESQRSIKIAGEIGRAGIAPVVNDSGAIPARPFRGADCFAVGRPGLMAFHGLGKREAERCAKELAAALLQGYVIAEVTLRAEDGARRVGGWTRFAVREGADAIAAVQGLTGRRVEKVRPRPRS
jgi:hypothetical protein